MIFGKCALQSTRSSGQECIYEILFSSSCEWAELLLGSYEWAVPLLGSCEWAEPRLFGRLINGRIIGKLLWHVLVIVGSCLLKIYKKGISKMEMARVWFTGHWSNPNLTDYSPENPDFHDVLICCTCGNPDLWIWIYRIIEKYKNTFSYVRK